MTDEQEQMLRDVHEALLAEPPGGGEPFITRATRAVQFYERTIWAVRSAVWIILTVGGIAVSREHLIELWQNAKR